MKPSPVWSAHQLEVGRDHAEAHFREGRRTEAPELYQKLFDEYRSVVEEVFALTADLWRLRSAARSLVADARKLEILRYLLGPPVSADDLNVLLHQLANSIRSVRPD